MKTQIMDMDQECPVCGEQLQRRYEVSEDRMPVGKGFCPKNRCEIVWMASGTPVDRRKLM